MNHDETPPIHDLPVINQEDGPRETTMAYGSPRRRLPSVVDCNRDMLLAIAAQGATGKCYELQTSAAHLAAICHDYVAIARELAAATPATQAGLHACAQDYFTNPSTYTGIALENAAVRATIARLRGTGEIVPAEAMLLLRQLSEDACRCGSDDPTCKCYVPVELEAF